MAPDKTNEPALIEAIELSVGSVARPDVPSLEKVNWRLRRGDFWVIGGLNGSGKTDLLATMAALQRPLHGNVHWFGHDIWPVHGDELIELRRRVGIVFENGGRMLRQLTVAENVALPIRYHQNLSATDAEEKVAQLLERTELTSRAHTTAGTLSSGWQQRVGLARALALQPEVLLVDKPMAGRGQIRWWMDFLSQLSEKTTVAVMVDDPASWRQFGRQFAVLRSGRFEALGEREEFARHAEPVLREMWTEL